jgi:hypothetical protein
MRLSRRELDEVQMTLCDRGTLKLEERRVGDSPKPSLIWVKKEPEADLVLPEKSTPEAGRDNLEG